MGVVVQHRRGRAAAIALAALSHPAAAQRIDVEADGTVNVGYSQTKRAVFVSDPNALPSDIPSDTVGGSFVEIRPGIMLQRGSSRLTWRAGYVFSGIMTLIGDRGASFSNQVDGSLAAQLTKFTTLTTSAMVAQGGTSFLLTQRPAEAGQPELRAPSNPNLISATLAESLAWEVSKHVRLQQILVAGTSAPQDDFGARSSNAAASLALERVFTRDTLGLELHGAVAWLRPLRMQLEPYRSYTNSVRGRWNHDFTPGWNGQVSAGLEQVYTDTGSRPLAFLPAGTASLRYSRGDVGAALDISQGTATNLQVGSISLTDQVSVSGSVALDSRKARALAFSAGILHNEPLGEVETLVAAGTGNAVQADAGFTTEIARNVLGSARYSLAYQFGQAGGLPPSLTHVFFIGVTGVLRTTERPLRPVPRLGRRVDGSDGDGFDPVEGAAPP